MNIFVLGLPLKIALGFFVLMVVLPVTVEIMAEQMERYVEFALRGSDLAMTFDLQFSPRNGPSPPLREEAEGAGGGKGGEEPGPRRRRP